MNVPGNISGNFDGPQPTQDSYSATSAANRTAATQSTAADQASAGAPVTSSGADQTHLSAAANIVSQSLGQTDVRTEKVASVQAAIASGSYHVDTSQVAGKLIDHMLGNGQ
jgi:negative regulator of flagellin synthesis FlgM